MEQRTQRKWAPHIVNISRAFFYAFYALVHLLAIYFAYTSKGGKSRKRGDGRQ